MRIAIKEARAIAADWHSGQASPLYSFCSTGLVHFKRKAYYEEIMGCYGTADEKESRRLDSLMEFLDRHHKRLKPAKQ